MVKRDRAFTLIELLVVIGIIATLIAILLPTLSSVRRQARLAVCMSNQRQVVLAALVYANDHDGQLPIPQHPAGTGAFIGGWDPLLCVYQSDFQTVETLVKNKPVNFGYLVSTGYAIGAIFYDPSDNPQASFDTYNRPAGWGAAGGDLARSGYYCNPHAITSMRHPRMYAGINTQYGIAAGLANFSQAGQVPSTPYDMLTMDRPSLGDERRGHGYTWNVGFTDGSVRSFTNAAAIDCINHYNGTDPTAVWKNWALHEQFITLLMK